MAMQFLLSQRLLSTARPSIFRPATLNRCLSISTRRRTVSPIIKLTPAKPTGKQTLFAERQIIFHSGTGRTVFIGGLKLTTIFIFTFFVAVVIPTYIYADDGPYWTGAAVTLAAATIPMVFVMYVSGPFVNYIHLRIPPYARNSREMLLRYSKSLPKDAELDITTMNVLGKLRVSRTKVSELIPIKKRLGVANIGRDTREINSKRAWWMGRAVREFGVHPSGTKIMGGEVWKNVAARISRNSSSA